jgi:AcrR family transcriptional regulator
VEDLTRAAGISKGAFYLFFDSKEELYFAIIEQVEEQFRASVFAGADDAAGSPRERFKAMLRRALALWEEHPLFSRTGREEYAQLLRKLPAEKVLSHLREDEAFVSQLLAEWQRQGVAQQSDLRLVVGLARTFFLVSLHRDEFEADVYPQVMETLAELIANYLVKEESHGTESPQR